MKKICLIVALMFSTVALAEDAAPKLHLDDNLNSGVVRFHNPQEWVFMEVEAVDHGKPANEKFFIGPLPEPGQAVEMIYIGPGENGSMKFQLRVKQP